MTAFGVTMMKDEEDVAEQVLCHMVDEELDGLIVADNMSTDGTRAAINRSEKYARDRGVSFTIIEDEEPGYYQSRKMTALANMAASKGAEWIVPFDADEIWFDHVDRLGVVLKQVRHGKNLVKALLFNHFETILDDRDEPDPFRRMAWKKTAPAPLHKIAFRWEAGCVIEQGNHSVILPSGHRIDHELHMELRHFPYRGFEHFKKKAINGAKAYEATDLPIDMGAHWRSYGRILEERGEDELRKVYDEFFWFAVPTEMDMIHDPAPIQRW